MSAVAVSIALTNARSDLARELRLTKYDCYRTEERYNLQKTPSVALPQDSRFFSKMKVLSRRRVEPGPPQPLRTLNDVFEHRRHLQIHSEKKLAFPTSLGFSDACHRSLQALLPRGEE